MVAAELVLGVEDALGHEDFYDVEEGWVAVQVEADLVEDEGLCGDELVLLAVEAHVVWGLPTLQSGKAALVGHLIALLLSLCWLVAWELAQEFSGAGNVRILFEVLGSNKEAAKSLKHNGTLVHVLFMFL